ncbi:MAG: hypothetical protein Q8Q20_04800 [bacterium]|nr:hypothetical protein [bacterium]
MTFGGSPHDSEAIMVNPVWVILTIAGIVAAMAMLGFRYAKKQTPDKFHGVDFFKFLGTQWVKVAVLILLVLLISAGATVWKNHKVIGDPVWVQYDTLVDNPPDMDDTAAAQAWSREVNDLEDALKVTYPGFKPWVVRFADGLIFFGLWLTLFGSLALLWIVSIKGWWPKPVRRAVIGGVQIWLLFAVLFCLLSVTQQQLVPDPIRYLLRAFIRGLHLDENGLGFMALTLSVVAITLHKGAQTKWITIPAVAMFVITSVNFVHVIKPGLLGDHGQAYSSTLGAPAVAADYDADTGIVSFDTQLPGPHPVPGLVADAGDVIVAERVSHEEAYTYLHMEGGDRVTTVRGDTLDGGQLLYPGNFPAQLKHNFLVTHVPTGAAMIGIGDKDNWFAPFVHGSSFKGAVKKRGQVFVDINDTFWQEHGDGYAHLQDNRGTVRFRLVLQRRFGSGLLH